MGKDALFTLAQRDLAVITMPDMVEMETKIKIEIYYVHTYIHYQSNMEIEYTCINVVYV